MKQKSLKRNVILSIGKYKTTKLKKVQITHLISSIDGGEDVAFGYLFKGKKSTPMLWNMNGKHVQHKKYNIKKQCEW
jgi:hypothetical protein